MCFIGLRKRCELHAVMRRIWLPLLRLPILRFPPGKCDKKGKKFSNRTLRILISASVGQRATFCAGADRRVEAVASSEGVGGRGEREHNDCRRHWPILLCWLNLQVDILMLDLDVGFMDSPLKLLDLVLNDSSVDILVQVSGSIAWSATLVGLIICL